MARVAREGFTAAADVADVLALDGGLDYRTAHKVVGRAVRALVEAGEGALTAEAVSAAALELAGTAVALDPAELDPAACAQARRQAGLLLARGDARDAGRGRRRQRPRARLGERGAGRRRGRRARRCSSALRVLLRGETGRSVVPALATDLVRDVVGSAT